MNKNLHKLLNKKTRTVIGLLSGTSVDAIDAVLLKITGNGVKTKIRILDFSTLIIPHKVRMEIFKNSDKTTAKIEDISRLNVIIGALFADAVLKLLKKHRLSAAEVDLIGSHGQTVHHLPVPHEYA
ncbi:MAG: anhydro-N-acetylmuramic acid kinase, partial [Ignavibacteria bacterium]